MAIERKLVLRRGLALSFKGPRKGTTLLPSLTHSKVYMSVVDLW
jgi:hypothetical protein